MPKPTGIPGQPRIQGTMPAVETKDPSLAQQTAARVPILQKMAGTPATLDNRSIQPAAKPAGNFFTQWWNFAKRTDEFITSDAKVAEVTKERERLRAQINLSCGSPVISDFIRQESIRRAPWARNKIREYLCGEGQGILSGVKHLFGVKLEAALARRPTLLEECLEVNLLQIFNNLAAHVKGDAKGPIPPNELINAMMRLGSNAGGQELAVLKKIEEIDRQTGLSETQKKKAKDAIYNQVTEHLLQVGLPHGAQDLNLPLPPGGSSLFYKYLIKGYLPDFVRQMAETLKSANQEHVDLLEELKKVSSDGEAVAGKLAVMARETVQNLLQEKGDNLVEQERKSNPLLYGVLSQFLKDCKTPEMKLLFEKADTFLYPLTVHILGRMAKNADKGEGKKPLLSLLSTDVLKEIREFVDQHPRAEFQKAIQSYQKQVDELEKVAADNIQEIEQEYGDVSAPAMAARKVQRDNLIRDLQKKKEEFLEQVKSPFDPLVNKLIQKMGVDEKGLAPILPYGQKLIADWIKGYLNKICLEGFHEIVEREGQSPHSAGRLTGYKEGRQIIQDMLKQLLPKFQATLPDLTTLQPYVEPWIVDTVSDLFANLADSNPLTKGQAQVDILNGALQHIAHIAVTKWKDASFVAQVDALSRMAEGPEKEKAKKKVWGPLATEIKEKAFKEGLRLPFKDAAEAYIEGNLLPALLHKAAEKWLMVQSSIAKNEAILQDQTIDGDAVAQAVKVVSDQTGAVLSDKGKKLGEALETADDRTKEAGIEYSLRDALVAAFDREPALKSLKNPLIQLLKGAQDIEPVRELLKKADGLTYPLFMHVLAHLTEKAKGQPATGAAVVNNLLQSISSFAADHRDELSEAFPKEDRKAFAKRFAPLVNEILDKAGLDPEGLAKAVPFGSASLSELIKSQALDFCADFYSEVAAKEGQAPEAYRKLPGYQEARHFLKEALQDSGGEKGLMTTIKETLAKGKYRRIMQNSLADVVNELLYEGKLPFEKSWIRKMVKELVAPSAPHLQQLEDFVQPYIVDSVTDLFAHLALSQHPSKGDMVQDAIAHLVAIMKKEIKDPDLVKKLTEWKALAEGTDEEKRVKAKQKEKLRKELFGECSSTILDKANVRAPNALRPFLKKLLVETVLPDQMFRIAADMLVAQPLSPVEELRLQNMGGRDELNLIVEGMAEKFTPVILQKTKEYADLIAAKANEKLAHNHLSILEEAWLGKDADSLLVDGELKPARNFVEYYLGRLLHHGLTKLALKHEEEGDLAGNVALYLGNRLRDFPMKPTLRETIRIYFEQTAPLRAFDEQIAQLRKQAIKEYPQVSEKTSSELSRLKKERLQKEQEIDKKDGIKTNYQELLKAFEPEVKKLLEDMGFAKAESLPVPYFLKDILWKNLTGGILPDLCLTSAEKLLGTYDMVIPRRKELENEIKKYEDLLTQFHVSMQRKSNKDYRLPPHVRVSPMVSAIEKMLPDFVEKFAASQVALKGKDWALGAIDETLIPMMYSGKKGQAAALRVDANRKEIASWIDQESPAMVEFLKERFGKSMKDVMKAAMLKSTYHFLHNLETLEKNNPEKLFEFMFNAVPLASDHIQTTTAIAQKHKGLLKTVHIHQLDSLTILKEFEKAGKLHPAMPGVKEFKALRDEEEHIRQLDDVVKRGLRKGSNWHKNVDRLNELAKEPEHSPESYLEAARTNRDELLKQIDAKMKDRFFNDFGKYLMNMGGIRGPQDIPGGETFLKTVWEMTSKAADVEREYSNLGDKKLAEQKAWEKFVESRVFQPAASGVMDLVKSAFAPEQLNSYLAQICTALNDKLKTYKLSSSAPAEGDFDKSPAADAKMDAMEERCQIFWKQVKRMLPVSVVKELQELPVIQQIPGKKMAEWTRSILREYPLSKMVETGIAKSLSTLPEKLPMSIEEAHEAGKQAAEKDKANIKTVRDEAAQTVPIFVKMIVRNIKEKLKRIHDKIEAWLKKVFGQRFVDVKAFFDNIFYNVFHTVLISFILAPARWIISYGLVLWGKVVSRDVEIARRNIVMQDPDKKKDPDYKEERQININANLLFKMADELMKDYPARVL